MIFTKKRVISLVLSVALVIFLTLSMASCDLIDFDIKDIFNLGESQEDTDNDFNNTTGGGSSSASPDFIPDAGADSTDNVSALNRTLLSSVSIKTEFGLDAGLGSGVIYQLDKENGNAYIITNYHVIYHEGLFTSCSVYLYGMEAEQYEIPVTFVGGSLINDIAVLKATASNVLKNSHAVAAPFANSEQVRVFDTAYAVGNPEGYGLSATHGIVSVESEPLDIDGADGSNITLRVMRTSAPINLGNSGGGLYNDKGEIIGIVCAKRVGADVDNFTYAIPSTLAKNLADNIIAYCNGSSETNAQRPLIGISVKASAQGVYVDEQTGEIKPKHVTTISKITSDCVIKDKIAIDDVINSIKINDTLTAIERYHQVPDTMLTARVNDTVTLSITRAGVTFDVTFTVTAAMLSDIK